MIGAFQSNAFQNNAFQTDGTGAGGGTPSPRGGGGWRKKRHGLYWPKKAAAVKVAPEPPDTRQFMFDKYYANWSKRK